MTSEALRDELRREIARERLIRDVAFLPVTETIAGYEVAPLTLRHYLSLRLAGSPFVCGGTPLPRDAFVFLWQTSLAYSPHDTRAKRKLYRRCRRDFIPPNMPAIHWPWSMLRWASVAAGRALRFAEVAAAIADYYHEATIDWPSGGGDGKSYYSEAAGLCEEMAAAHSWTDDYTLGRPLKALFQHIKIIRAKAAAKGGKQPIMFNPSDALIGRLALAEDEEINHGRNN